ncbi:hypothetical protein RP20_CCG024498 [Aedes albopictus]|nr:hypothetical protein RP20_CCG024498 [Aedes albopictus]
MEEELEEFPLPEMPLPAVPDNDPTQFCRLCFSQKDINWVIRTCGTEVDLPFVNTIGECLGIWLSLEEDFPYAVCLECTKRLEGIIEFREISRRCDEALKAKRREDPNAMVLFYDYPEDKVFMNGSNKPGCFRDDPDFEAEAILPEVILSEEKAPDVPPPVENPGQIRMSQAEKKLALKNYMDSYLRWTSEIESKKDDDEATDAAPETEEHENVPELSILSETYINLDRRTPPPPPPPIKKPVTLSGYTCSVCRKTFRTKAILQDHRAAVHRKSTEKKIKGDSECLDCGQVFMTVNLMKLHAMRHRRDMLISCKTCGIQFVKEHELQAHLKNNGCRMMAFGKCKYCDRVFSRRGRYIFHLKNLHPDKPLPEPDEIVTDRNESETGSTVEQDGRFVVMLDPLPDEVVEACRTNERLVCTLCYEQFSDLPSYNGHHPACFNQHYDGITGSGSSSSSSSPPPPYKLCECDTCTAIFESIDPFVEHLREHEQPLRIKPHDCVQCSGRNPKFLMHPHSPSMILGD